MSNYKNKKGTGVLWKNDKYTKGGNQPYAYGRITDLSGRELDAALWIPKNEKIRGFNITISEKWEKGKKEDADRGINDDSSLPF